MDQATHNKIVSFTRLVADVVTGKLDVREAAALLPEEAGESLTESETDWSDDETELDPIVSEEGADGPVCLLVGDS